ncbi:MAG: CDP-alcohol phosphatidyltransferase family protein [Phycisphaerales bacterium]|nr:MAG: CDP-alcohol phosphatidyltransferase family protein [Phycisphaerales bacterium]
MSRAIASWLARLGVSPNTISIFGLIAAVVAGSCLAWTGSYESYRPLLFIGAAGCIGLRLLANMLDGMVAVEHNRLSPTGEVFNEVPDRLADIAVLVGAGYAHTSEPALGYLAAIAALMTAYVRALGKSLGLPSDYRGPMAKPHRMGVVILACLALAIIPSLSTARMFWDSVGGMGAAIGVVALGSTATTLRRLVHLLHRLRSQGS